MAGFAQTGLLVPAQEIKTEEDLADLFAMIENKAWWVEDEAYDFEVGTEEYKRARESTTFWFALAENCETGFLMSFAQKASKYRIKAISLYGNPL